LKNNSLIIIHRAWCWYVCMPIESTMEIVFHIFSFVLLLFFNTNLVLIWKGETHLSWLVSMGLCLGVWCLLYVELCHSLMFLFSSIGVREVACISFLPRKHEHVWSLCQIELLVMILGNQKEMLFLQESVHVPIEYLLFPKPKESKHRCNWFPWAYTKQPQHMKVAWFIIVHFQFCFPS